MKKYVIRQILYGLVKLFIVLLIVFLLIKAMKVDVVPEKATLAVKRNIRHQLGLDLPIYTQFFNFIIGAFTLNLGESWKLQQGISVMSIISEKLSFSLVLALSSFAISLFAGMAFGRIMARNVGNWKDSTSSLVILLLHSVPTFVIGVFIQYLGNSIGLPSSYDDSNIMSWFLPILSLSLILTSSLSKNFRFYFIDVYTQEYVTTARAKGLTEAQVMQKHVQRNAMIPMIAPVVMTLFAMIVGTISIERLFNIPGVGSLIIDAVNSADQPVILGMVFLITTFTIMATIIINILYAVIDPRVRV